MSTGRVILVIEDDHEVRAFLGDILRDEGYQVLLAESGEAALEHLTTVQPDLITTDLNLPGIGGVSLSRRFANNQLILLVQEALAPLALIGVLVQR